MKHLLSLLLFTAALAADSPPVRYLAADDVARAFTKGEPLVETATYKIHASRREKPGLAEVHATDTDIVHVLEGTATVITGGAMVDGKTIAANEFRGASISGGESRRLAKGDVIVIPNGVPHQFVEVDGPFLYYVVKVTEPAGGAR